MEASPGERESLRRRNSIATAVKLTIPANPQLTASLSTGSGGGGGFAAAASSSPDLELISMIRPLSYTSLKDLLPSTAVNSPTASSSAAGGSDLCIRNHLVKQAAWAYLQPSSASPSRRSAADDFLARIWLNFTAFIRFVSRTLTRAFRYLLRSIRVWCLR